MYQKGNLFQKVSKWEVIFKKGLKSHSKILDNLKSPLKSPLKIMGNAIYFTLKPIFTAKIFKFFPLLFQVQKQLDQKDQVNFEINDVTSWLTNICNTHIAQYLKK